MRDEISKIERLQILAERAANHLLGESKRLIPVSTRVSYEIQRNNRKHRIYGYVTGHGVHRSWATFFVENEATGKVREVTISAWGLRVESGDE